MTRGALVDQGATRRLVQVIVELGLCSQVRGTNYDPSGSGGGDAFSYSVPPGGVDHIGDSVAKAPGFVMRSAEHFARRLDRLLATLPRDDDDRVVAIRDEILRGAEESLQLWRIAPRAAHPHVSELTEHDKILIANDVRSCKAVADEWGLSHPTVLRYRRQYRVVA